MTTDYKNESFFNKINNSVIVDTVKELFNRTGCSGYLFWGHFLLGHSV